jgi:hypothetical protein
MEPHLRRDPPEFAFPPLLIVTPDSPRRTEREKYGGLFYLGLLGLITILALVGWFAYGVWSMRHVWRAIYVLHDEHHSEAERIEAAYTLGRDPRLNQRQLWEMSLRKPLPSLARYALAEALTAEATSADPRGYALTVARSPGWPDWLRVLLLRPMAYAAARGVAFPRARRWTSCAGTPTRWSGSGPPSFWLRSIARRPTPGATWSGFARRRARTTNSPACSWTLYASRFPPPGFGCSTRRRSGSGLIMPRRPGSGKAGRSRALGSCRDRPRNCRETRRSPPGCRPDLPFRHMTGQNRASTVCVIRPVSDTSTTREKSK